MITDYDDDVTTLAATVALDELVAFGHPLDGSEWDCAPVSRTAVLVAVADGAFERETWDAVNRRYRAKPFDDVSFHVGRVAFLLAEPDEEPIDVEPEGILDRFVDGRRVRVLDGNHRLAAADIRGERTVLVRFDQRALVELKRLMPSLEVVPSLDMIHPGP